MWKIIRTFSSSASRRNTEMAMRVVGYLNKLSDKTSEIEKFSKKNEEDITLLSRYKLIEPSFRELQENLRDIEELKNIVDDPQQDSEFRDIAKADLEVLVPKVSDLVNDISSKIVVDDEYDGNSASMEVVPGAGGLEASMFAEEIFEFYCNYNLGLGHEVEVTEFVRAVGSGKSSKFSSTSGIVRASANISGRGVFRTMKYECGVHRVQRVPVTGTKSDRLQTSTCSVAVVPIPDDADIKLDPNDLKFEFMRSSGAGGQNVNKVDSACRVTHLPTGKTAHCEEERKPMHNKEKALLKLKAMMYKEKYEKEMARVSATRKVQVGSMNRNEKIRTYNFNRNTIVDHRLAAQRQVSNLPQFLQGSLGFDIVKEFYENLEANAQKEKLLELLDKES